MDSLRTSHFEHVNEKPPYIREANGGGNIFNRCITALKSNPGLYIPNWDTMPLEVRSLYTTFNYDDAQLEKVWTTTNPLVERTIHNDVTFYYDGALPNDFDKHLKRVVNADYVYFKVVVNPQIRFIYINVGFRINIAIACADSVFVCAFDEPETAQRIFAKVLLAGKNKSYFFPELLGLPRGEHPGVLNFKKRRMYVKIYNDRKIVIDDINRIYGLGEQFMMLFRHSYNPDQYPEVFQVYSVSTKFTEPVVFPGDEYRAAYWQDMFSHGEDVPVNLLFEDDGVYINTKKSRHH